MLRYLNRRPRLVLIVLMLLITLVSGGVYTRSQQEEDRKPAPEQPEIVKTTGPYITVAPPIQDADLGVGTPIRIWVEDLQGLTEISVLTESGIVLWKPTVIEGQRRVTTTFPWIPDRIGDHTFIVQAITLDGRTGEKEFTVTAACCEINDEINIGYVVQEGDYPPAVAAGFGICFDELLAANPYLADIGPGDVLNIPYRISSEDALENIDETCARAPVNFFNNPEIYQEYPRSETAIPVEGNHRIDRGFGCSEFYTGYLGTGCPADKPWFHTGVDIAVPVGEPVRTVAGGTIVHAGPDAGSQADCSQIAGSQPPHNGYGRYVRMLTPDGTVVIYAHLSAITTTVGEEFDGGGYLVGLAGSTGCSTGPHLHLELRRGSVAVDPIPYIEQVLRRLEQWPTQ